MVKSHAFSRERLNRFFQLVYFIVPLSSRKAVCAVVLKPASVCMTIAAMIAAGSAESVASAPTYLGLYLQNHKIGYASYSSHQTTFRGQRVEQSDTHTEMDAGLLGTPLKIEIDSTTYLTNETSPIEMDFQMKSNGRTQTVKANFKKSNVVIAVNNSGEARTIILKMPDGPVVDDPMNLFLKHQAATKCFILDPSTVSFVPNEVKLIGSKTLLVNGRSTSTTLVDLIDPRATTHAYLDSHNNLVRAEGLMGIVMLPETAAIAMEPAEKYSKGVDIGYTTSIVPTGELEHPASTTELKLKFEGKNLGKLPNDEAQTVRGSEGSWTIDIHPPRLAGGVSISEARSEKPDFTKPDLDIPSDSPEIVALAKRIVGSRTNALDAAVAIKEWVYSQMRPNAGIGVLRDAREVLKTKEGVCRDYAILTATLLKSAGIPTRLASGLVNWDGTFYYHAWDEVWNGSQWIGIDSTTPDKQISAAHIKLAEGSVAEAFNFAVLDHVRIQVLSSQQ
jgi:hypothetical protein